MTAAEGAANMFRLTQAQTAMKRLNPKTPAEAADINYKAGVVTRIAMEQIGGMMPEDMPVADSIKEAKKRVKQYKPLLER